MRFAVYRDQQLIAEADDIADVLAQAKEPGDLINGCAVHDRDRKIMIIVTGWVPIGQPVNLVLPDEP